MVEKRDVFVSRGGILEKVPFSKTLNISDITNSRKSPMGKVFCQGSLQTVIMSP